MSQPRKMPVVFYRTAAGDEVVRNWLLGLNDRDRSEIGQDLLRVQYRWPIGMPLCRAMGAGLWEVRSNLQGGRIAGVLFSVQDGKLLVLHGFIKKTQKTRDDDVALARKRKREFNSQGCNMKKKKKMTRRSVRGLTRLDEFLSEEGKLEEFEAVAIKEVLAWQIAEAMKEQNLSRKRLAERMKTSRSQIGRLLDPKDGNVTIATLQRAAKIVGRTLRLELL
jgi:phage-related protein/predicted XRE-type DNA-binding protein